MSKLAILALTLSACATSGLANEQATERGPRAKLDLGIAATGAQAAYPKLTESSTRSIDRMSHAIRSQLGDTARAELDLCTSPAGRVTKVALARSSSMDAFDAALVRDAETWEFEAMPGPATAQSCRRATVTYRVH